MEVDYGLDQRGRIVSFNYSGVITLNDVRASWIDAINRNIIQTNIRGFVLDYREAIMNFDVDETIVLSNFFRNNLSIFQQKRFAYITQSPDQIILPILLQEYDFNYESKPFSSPEAAIDWLLN